MFNDLIFPILPREGKVPLKYDSRVQKIGKITDIKALGEDERSEHDEERRVSGQQVREQRERGGHNDGGQFAEESFEAGQYGPDGQLDEEAAGSESDNPDPSEDETAAQEDDAKIKHLDIYI